MALEVRGDVGVASHNGRKGKATNPRRARIVVKPCRCAPCETLPTVLAFARMLRSKAGDRCLPAIGSAPELNPFKLWQSVVAGKGVMTVWGCRSIRWRWCSTVTRTTTRGLPRVSRSAREQRGNENFLGAGSCALLVCHFSAPHEGKWGESAKRPGAFYVAATI